MTVSLHRRRRLLVLALAVAASPGCIFGQITGNGTTPVYSAQSIVNAATQTLEALAPNTIATLYGSNLSFDVRSVATTDIVKGMMPTTLDGVGVWVNSIPCSLFYVSPTQINFLVPYQLTAGTVSLVVARNSQAGPTVSIQLNNTSPGLFQWNGNSAVAGHLNGVVLSAGSPAMPGEIVVLYVAGLGRTAPDTTSGQLATSAFQIYYRSQLQILLDGKPCPAANILYAGLAPGFAGLYQINLRLPDDVGDNPQIQISIGPRLVHLRFSWRCSRRRLLRSRRIRRDLSSYGGFTSTMVMRITMPLRAPSRVLWIAFAFVLPAVYGQESPATPAATYTIETGTRIPLALISSASSKNSAPGDRIYLETAFPIVNGNHIVIPTGSYVTGTVTEVKRPGKVKGRGQLYVRFDSITLPNGITREFRSRLGSVDARSNEKLDQKEGQIVADSNKGGDVRTAATSGVTGASIGAIAGSTAGHAAMGAGIGAAAGVAAGMMAVLFTRGPDAELTKGSTIEMVLDRPLTFAADEVNFTTMAPGHYAEGPGPQPNRNPNPGAPVMRRPI